MNLLLENEKGNSKDWDDIETSCNEMSINVELFAQNFVGVSIRYISSTLKACQFKISIVNVCQTINFYNNKANILNLINLNIHCGVRINAFYHKIPNANCKSIAFVT